MIPIQQTKFHSDSQKGNCLAACIASLLEISLNQVPEFEEMDREDWQSALLDFLLNRGKTLSILYDEVDFKLEEAGDSCYIANGRSPRDLDVRHAVIFKNGKLEFDPHPSGDGILTEESYWVIK